MKRRQPHRKTGGLALTRERLGLTQRQMAMVLGISKSTVAMVESYLRSLPTGALVQLAIIEREQALQLLPRSQEIAGDPGSHREPAASRSTVTGIHTQDAKNNSGTVARWPGIKTKQGLFISPV